MKAFLVGIILIGVALYMFLPFEWALGWTTQTIETLKGIAPIALVAIGLISVLLGIADIRDSVEAHSEQDSNKT